MSSIISLNDRHTDATRELILATAIELLETKGFADLTVRSVAKFAGMSERTVFRYFATKDDFLDATAAAAAVRMQTPPPPSSIEELIEFPAPLYRSFEKRKALVEASLHTEIFRRIRVTSAADRWKIVAKLIDENAAGLSKNDRMITSTNICYYLSASTWHYYRSQFGLSLDDTILYARAAVRAIIGTAVHE